MEALRINREIEGGVACDLLGGFEDGNCSGMWHEIFLEALSMEIAVRCGMRSSWRL